MTSRAAANGWTATGGSFGPTPPAPAGTSTPARQVKAQYYLAEWRNFDGFDKGLKYAYDTDLLPRRVEGREDQVQRPGMLVWYRDTTYGNDNHVTANITALPSTGSKGGLLIVD